MNYDHQILRILIEASPQGLSVKKIARHVFNQANGFFCTVDYDSVHAYVRQYLQRQATRGNGLVRRQSHGIYQFNEQTQEGRQLMLEFKEDEEPTMQKQQPKDQSLSLF